MLASFRPPSVQRTCRDRRDAPTRPRPAPRGAVAARCGASATVSLPLRAARGPRDNPGRGPGLAPTPSHMSAFRATRWWAAAGGLALAVVDTILMVMLGVTVPMDDAAAARACDFIVAEIDRLASVVASLLDFARPLHLEARAVSVRDLFDRAALLAAGELATKGARLARDESPALPAVLADPDLLSQVLLGLLANAAEAVPPGGDVMLAARVRDGAVELVVDDSGPGIP